MRDLHGPALGQEGLDPARRLSVSKRGAEVNGGRLISALGTCGLTAALLPRDGGTVVLQDENSHEIRGKRRGELGQGRQSAFSPYFSSELLPTLHSQH